MKDDMIYLDHILECIRRIEENIAAGHEVFKSSHTIQDAVLRNLQTMTESTQRLSDTLKNEHPEIAWSNVAGFRNVLVHDYLVVDLDLVWTIIETDLPVLKRAALAMRESEASGVHRYAVSAGPGRLDYTVASFRDV